MDHIDQVEKEDAKEAADLKKFEGRGEGTITVLPEVHPLSLIQVAIEKNYTPEFIEKMMDLQERNEARMARQAYNKAMSAFKANPPKVWKDIQVKYEAQGKTTSWSHADLGIAAGAINKALGEHGLNSTWRTLPLEDKKVRVTCVIAHELGHSEETYLEAGPDTTGSKNEIQAIGSTVFYLERYTLFALSGLAPARMDDDGVAASSQIVEFINEKELSELVDTINEREANEPVYLGYLSSVLGREIKELAQIPAKDFKRAMNELKKRKKPE